MGKMSYKQGCGLAQLLTEAEVEAKVCEAEAEVEAWIFLVRGRGRGRGLKFLGSEAEAKRFWTEANVSLTEKKAKRRKVWLAPRYDFADPPPEKNVHLRYIALLAPWLRHDYRV